MESKEDRRRGRPKKQFKASEVQRRKKRRENLYAKPNTATEGIKIAHHETTRGTDNK